MGTDRQQAFVSAIQSEARARGFRVMQFNLVVSTKWSFVEDYPFFLVLYDAPKRRAFWLDVHAFVEAHGVVQEGDDPETETVSLRIPVANKLTVQTIDMFHRMSLERMEAYKRLRKQD